jgi:hypothetical protein
MPKTHQQSTTTAMREPVSVTTENATHYLSASEPHLSESSKQRITNTNGKFSLQKLIRQSLSSWRTKKQRPPVAIPLLVPLSTHMSTPPSPPLSTGQ